MSYRSAGLQDVDAAARVVVGVYGGEPRQWAARLALTLDRPGAVFLVAEVDGVVVGYGKAAHCTPVGDDDAAPPGRYLTGLVVDPAWRRRGIGEELTRRRLQRIHADDEPAWFFTNAHNAASLALHANLGFTEVGRASSYLGEPFDGGVGVLLRADGPA